MIGACLLGLSGCAGDPDPEEAAKAATAVQAAANALALDEGAMATPDELERVLRLGGQRSVAEAAGALLASSQAAALSRADHWRVRRAQLIALAWLGQRDELDDAWAAAAGEHDASQLAALAGQIYVGLLAAPSTDRALLVDLAQRGEVDREAYRAGAMQPAAKLTDSEAWLRSRSEAVRRLALPYDHPEGFPRAWLAPDEQPREP
jgi:hypothetical protein